MTKKLNVVKFFLAFAIVTIFITGIYLCVLIPTLNSTQKTNNDEPELILQDEADFVIDGNGTFTSLSGDAESRVNDVETFGVILPAKVKEIRGVSSSPDGPFYSYRTKLISVEFAAESELTTIGGYAFYGCSSLTSITIPDGVTSIGEGAFRNCSGLETVEISQDASLQSIEDSAFYNCSSLTSITIPDGVTSIESYAFRGCSSLTSINIPEKVSSIGTYAFSVPGLETITVAAGNEKYKDYGKNVIVDTSSNTLILGCSNSSIPDEVTKIGEYAFSGSGITSIFIPENITYIDKYAFSYSRKLTSLTITDNVTSISDNAFCDCSGLETVEISQDASLQSIGYSAFYGCSSLTSINIPEKVSGIGRNAFYGCSSLTSIIIPDGVTSIGAYAFQDCSGLKTVEISQDSSLQSIGDNAFNGCSHLTNITIPDGVTSIGEGAFRNCSGLETVEISQDASLQSIEDSAFYNCSSLTSIIIPENVTSIGQEAFRNCSGLETITVAEGNEKYKDYGKNVIVNTSSNTLILGCSNSSIPDEVTKIDDYAFENCVGLTSITIPENVTTISSSAFRGCSGLQTITVAEGNEKYKDYGKNVIVDTSSNTLILGCSNSSIPDEVTNIRQNAFYGCANLTSITIPDSVTTIGFSAFQGCTNLTSITIPDSLTSIGDYAFRGCDNVVIIAGSKESAEKFQTNSSYNLTSYKDRITYVIDIELQMGSKTIALKKLYKQDIRWCLQENGAWEKVDDYQLPYSQEGSWQDSEGNTVTLSDLNDKLKNGEIEDGYVLNFKENPKEKNKNLMWILVGVLGGALVVAAGLTVVLVAYKKKEKQK